ncbi:hypothetical protein Tco_0414766 [Tanacetum coccineum]
MLLIYEATPLEHHIQHLPDDASPVALSSGYIADSDPAEDEEDPEEDPADYPANGGDDDDESSDDDDDVEEDEEEEEHLAPADSTDVASPGVDPVLSAEETKPFETDEYAVTPPPAYCTTARISVRPQALLPTSIEARITEFASAPTPLLPPPYPLSPWSSPLPHIPSPPLPLPSPPLTSPTYDQAPLGHREAMIRVRDDIPEEDMPPQKRFVLIALPPGPGHDARTIARAADRAEDVVYVRALQAFKHRMMTSIEEVNLRVSYQAQVCRKESKDFYTQLHDAQTDRRDIKLEIDVNRALLARLETLETHVSRMEWQHQAVEDRAVRQMMRTHVLEARAQIDMVEDTGATNAMTPESIQAIIDRAIQRNSTHTQDDASQSSGGGLRRHVQFARVCSYTDFMKCQPLNFKGTEGVVGLS